MNSSFSIVVIFAILGLGLFSAAVPLQEAFAGAPPDTVVTAKVTGGNTVTIVYDTGGAIDEDAAGGFNEYSNLQLSGVGNRPITAVSDNGDSVTHTITFGGDPVSTDTTGAIDITAFNVFLGSAGEPLTDGQGAVISNVSILSNNTDPTQAKFGDIISVTFTASEDMSGGGTFVATINELAVNGPSNTGGNNWQMTRSVGAADAEGGATFDIQANEDGSGNAGANVDELDETTGSVNVDKTSPDFSSTPDLEAASDTNIDNDNNTSNTTVTFSGTGELDAILTLSSSVDGALAPTTVVTESGWSITTNLTENVHNITASQTDPAGNDSGASATLTVTVDTTTAAAPSTPDLEAASDTGVNTDNVTSDTTPEFTGTGIEDETVTLTSSVDGTLSPTFLVIEAETWSITTTLTEGVHDITATHTDTAGNESVPSAALVVTIDDTPAAPPSALDLAAASDSGSSDTDNITTDTTPTITGTGVTGETVELTSDQQGALVPTTTVVEGAWSITTTINDNLTHDITARQTDTAGNVSEGSAGLSVTVDNLDPNAPVITTGAGTVLTANPTIEGTGEEFATVTLTSSIDGAIANTAIVAGGVWSITPAIPLTEVAHSLTATQEDPAGNTSVASGAVVLTVDALSGSIAYNPDTAVSAGTSLTGTVTFDEPVEDAPVPQFSVSGPFAIAGTNMVKVSSTEYTFTFTVGSGDGTATVTLLTAQAVSDNDKVVVGTPTAGATFEVDNVAPTLDPVTIASDNGNNTSLARDGDTITVSFTSANAIQNIDATINGKTAQISNQGGNNWIAIITIDETEEDGVVVFTLDFEDTAGTAGTQVADVSDASSVTVDNTAPGALTNVLISSEGADPTEAMVGDDVTLLFTTPDATDLVGVVLMDGDESIESKDGADYTVTHTVSTTEGTFTFSVDYTDAAGNPGPTTTATTDGSSVNVDTVAPAKPVIDVPANSATLTSDLIAVSGTAEPFSTVNVNLLTNVGNNPILTVTADSNGDWSGTTTTVLDGADVLFATATDAAGNQSVNSDPVAFTMDATPAAPIILNVTNLNSQTPTVNGIAQANALIKLSVDGVSSGQVTSNADGTWAITVTALQTEEAHTAVATSTTGNGESPQSAGFNFTVDLTSPAPPVITTTPGTTFNTATPTILGTGEVGATIALTSSINDILTDANPPVIVGSNNTWAFTPDADLDDNVHNLTATQTDAANNTSAASTPVNIQIATAAAAPVITSVGGQNPVDGAIPNTITINNPAIVGTSVAAEDSTITVKDGSTILGTTPVEGGTWTFNTTYSDGAHSVTANVTTVGGTSADSDAVTFTIDTTAALIASVNISSDNANDSTLSKATDTVTVTITGTEPITVVGPTTINGNDATGTITQVDTNTVAITRVMNGDAQGTVVFSATVEDANLNQSTVTITTDGSSVTHDSIAPNVIGATYTSNNADDTFTKAGDTGTLNLEANEALTDVVMTIDGKVVSVTADDGTNTAFTGSRTMLDTDANDVTLTTIDATDLAGNAMAQRTPAGVTHDSVAPAAPTIDDPGAIEDSVAVTGINDNSLNNGNGSVSLFDNGNLVGTDDNVGGGTFSVTSTIPYADGVHPFTAQSTDAAGNVSPLSDIENITVADGTPTPPVIVTPADGDFTNDTTPDFAGTAQPGMEVILFTPDSSGTQLGFGLADANGAWSITSSPLAEGTANYVTTGEQPDEDTSADSAATSLTVDITTPTTSPIVVAPVEGSTTNDSTPTINGTWAAGGDASVAPGGLVEVFVDGVSVGTDTVDGAGDWSVTVPAETPLANGSHTITLVATDGAGNAASAPAARTFTVDAEADAPIITSVAGQTPDGNGNLANDVATATPAIVGTTVAGASVQVFDGAGSLGFVTADSNGDWSFTPGTLGDGAHVFTATATTSGGTSAASTAVNATIDTAVPSTPTIASPANASTVTTSAFTVSGNGDSGTTINVLDTDGTVIGTTTAAGGTYTVLVNPLLNGAHALSAISTDSAGNVSPASGLTVVTVNAPVPGTPIITEPTEGADLTENDVTVSGTGTVGSTVEVTVASDVISAGTVIVDNNGDWTLTTPPLHTGAHTITAIASDAAGNTSDVSTPVNITISDVSLATVTGTVFTDTNNNAVQDEGEDGIAGVIVILAAPSTTTLTETTDADGLYTFSNVAENISYLNQLTPVPTGFVTATGTNSFNFAIVLAGETVTINYALVPLTSSNEAIVSGIVFEDTNNDGVQDPGEPGLENARVIVVDLLQNITEEAFTDSDGAYSFSGLTPGAVSLVQHAPVVAGHIPSDGFLSFSFPTLSSGNNTVDFPLRPTTSADTGTIIIEVFNDANSNGIKDTGEGGVEGATVFTFVLLTAEADVQVTPASGITTHTDLLADVVLAQINAVVLPAGFPTITTSNGGFEFVILTAGDTVTVLIGLAP